MKIKISVLLLGIATLLACNSGEKTNAEAPETESASNEVTLTALQFKNMDLSLGNLSMEPFTSEIEATGMVDVPPENLAMVSSPIPGVIRTITHNVLPGKYVTKGNLLAVAQSMDLIQIQQDYLASYLKQELLSQEYERQKLLVSQDAGVKRKLQEAESNWKLNKAQTASLEAKLRLANVNLEKLKNGEVSSNLYIYAPISGFIKTVNVNTGTNFTSADKLFEIISKEHLHVELKVFEKDASALKEGQTVIFNDPSIPENTKGRVFLIAKTFDETSKSVNVHVHLENEVVEAKLIPGQYLTGKIQLSEQTRPVIPESAILREPEGNFVMRLKSKTNEQYIFEKIALKTGGIKNGKVEVLEPTELTDVVISGANLLNGGGDGE